MVKSLVAWLAMYRSGVVDCGFHTIVGKILTETFSLGNSYYILMPHYFVINALERHDDASVCDVVVINIGYLLAIAVFGIDMG